MACTSVSPAGYERTLRRFLAQIVLVHIVAMQGIYIAEIVGDVGSALIDVHRRRGRAYKRVAAVGVGDQIHQCDCRGVATRENVVPLCVGPHSGGGCGYPTRRPNPLRPEKKKLLAPHT